MKQRTGTASHKAYRRLIDTSEKYALISKDEIREALGAESVESKSQFRGSPPSVAALRARLVDELTSSGGRPARKHATHAPRIPLTATEWQKLSEITKAVRDQGVRVSAGQVAGVLLGESLSMVQLTVPGATPPNQRKVSQSVDLEAKVEQILAAAASAEESIEELRPIAKELLSRMRASRR